MASRQPGRESRFEPVVEQAAIGRIKARKGARFPAGGVMRDGLRVALFEPDRPHNLGMMLRLGACLDVAVDVIEPCGFPLDDRRIRFGALDYLARVEWCRHLGFDRFLDEVRGTKRRLVLLSTAASLPYHRLAFRDDDILLLGRESAGVPDKVRDSVDCAVRVPLRPGLRSLNVVTAAAIVLGEALRQTGCLETLADVSP